MSGPKKYSGKLHLFTTRFPYGMSEPFLENELPYLCEFFEEVLIYPLFKDAEVRTLPLGAVLVDLFDDPFRVASFKKLAMNLRMFRQVLREEKVRPVVRSSGPARAELNSSLRQNLERALVLKRSIGKVGRADVFYSYWTFDWATVLSLLVKMKTIDGFVSRVHGFDLYEDRNKKGFIPFRALHLACASKIIAVSKDGIEYLKKNHEEYSTKFYLSQLGVEDRGAGPNGPSKPPCIVSCSYVIALKRVGLIADALKAWNKPVYWVHFGGGKEFDELKEKVSKLPGHIKVELKGPVLNAQVLAHYQEFPVDLFLHLSSSEGGVSVAMQEAASFGIPLMGTAVGGVPEICNRETGVLLSSDPTVAQVVDALEGFFSNSTGSPELRRSTRAFWKRNFDAARIFPLFCQLLVAR